MCRELNEESNLMTYKLEKIGILTFDFVEKPILMEVHVFTTNEFTGEPLESEGILNDKYG